jgi:16S rRNA (guanine527-N7)-methyltransferase
MNDLPPSTAPYEAELHRLVDTFLEENAKLNLSALRTPETCWHGNILDSLPVLDVLPATPMRILDVGTGGGFPLLPVAICRPEWICVGLDSVEKKINALDRIVCAIGIGNVDLLCGRTEKLGRNAKYRETFDAVFARAVAPINVLLEYVSPFCKPGGKVILWKSMQVDEELRESLLARAELSCHLSAQHEYTLPGTWGTRQLLIFDKTSRLLEKYPRDVGVPKKEPLK